MRIRGAFVLGRLAVLATALVIAGCGDDTGIDDGPDTQASDTGAVDLGDAGAGPDSAGDAGDVSGEDVAGDTADTQDDSPEDLGGDTGADTGEDTGADTGEDLGGDDAADTSDLSDVALPPEDVLVQALVNEPLPLDAALAGIDTGSIDDWEQTAGPLSADLEVSGGGDGTFTTWAAGTYLYDLQVGDTEVELTVEVWSLSTNGSNSLVVKPDGSLWGWGDNAYYDLALGDILPRFEPTRVGSDTDWAAVSLGYDFGLGLKNDGSAWAWGTPSYGELGIGSDGVEQPTPAQVCAVSGCGDHLSDVRQVIGGYYASYAVDAEGRAYAWGTSDGAGTLGQADLDAESLVPQPVCDVSFEGVSCAVGDDDLMGVERLVTGEYFVVALLTSGEVVAWGDNNSGQLGINHDDIAASAVPRPVCSPDDANALNTDCTQFLTGVARIAAGRYSAYAVGHDGSLVAWGYNSNGEIGDDSGTDAFKPVRVAGVHGGDPETDWTGVWAGEVVAFARKADSSLWGWGSARDGGVGNGRRTRVDGGDDATVPTEVCAVGFNTPCDADDDRNLTGVVGLTSDRFNDSVSIALLADGRLVSWGQSCCEYHLGGGLGILSQAGTPTPVLSEGAVASSGWAQVSSFETHTLALDVDGAVWAWGDNALGQLGTGDTIPRVAPARVCAVGETAPCTSFLTDVEQVSAGRDFSLALLDDGTVVSWGDNEYGKLGNGDSSEAGSNVPVPVCEVGEPEDSCDAFLSNIGAVAAGQEHALALREDDGESFNGEVLAWGNQDTGALGNDSGSAGSVTVPITVHGVGNVGNLEDVTAIAASYRSIAAGGEDGNVYTWGSGHEGALGDGLASPHTSFTPVLVCTAEEEPCESPLTDVVEVAAASTTGYARTSGGAVYAWGARYHGARGDGVVDNNEGVNYAEVVLGLDTGALAIASSGGSERIANLTLGSLAFALVDDDGTTRADAWGQGEAFATGQGDDDSDQPTPVPVCDPGATDCESHPLTGVTAIGSAISGGFAILEDTTMVAWGRSYFGLLGIGPGEVSASPWPLPAF